MNKLQVVPVFIAIIACLVGCRGDAENNVPDNRADIDPEMDLGTDNIGDQHFVGEDGYAGYDYDRNSYWNEDEFEEAYDKEQRFRIPVADEDNDGNLSLNDFSLTTFEIADTDDNNSLSKYEWDIAWQNMFHEFLEKDQFQSFDTDNDAQLGLQDWQTVVQESGWFEGVDEDSDGQVQLQEWLRYLFQRWDYDHDGELTENELRLYLDYYAAPIP